ncbi:MAG: glycoside hydrolase family 5 protein [Chloroflexi bacterium]|nr:glycoside hydrolase family 5 protein [Chloroflexota bacterium]
MLLIKRGWALSPLLLVFVLLLSACGASGSESETGTSAISTDVPPPLQVVAYDAADQRADQDEERARQVSPTPGFGPIITAGPATPTPDVPPATEAVLPTSTWTPVPPSPQPPAAPTNTPSISPTPLPTYRADMMGIQIDPGSQEGYDIMLSLAERLGVEWIKLQFRWDQMEPQQGVFSPTFYSYRLFVQQAHQKGFKVIASVAKAPAWARNSADEDGPPRDPQLLANFLTALLSEVRVDLYGNSYFSAIEVWNEPNLRREWNGAPINGGEYMRLFDAAYNAIRNGEGGHSIVIITAGLAPTGINDGVQAVDDRVYLQQMYDAGLNNPAYQNVVLGAHPYGAWNPPDARCCLNSGQGFDDNRTWFFLDNLEDYHAIMQQNGDSRLIWVTEFGWGTYEGFVLPGGDPAPPPPGVPYFAYIDETQQANYIMRAFEIGQNLPYVGPMILWNLNFSNTDYVVQMDERSAYAILRNDQATDPLRPAFQLLEAAPKQ